MVKYSIKISLKLLIKAVFLELDTTNDCAVSIKIKFPAFVLNLHHLPQPIWWLELRQNGNYVCSKQDPLSHFQGCKWGHLFFMTERDWSWKSCYGNKTKGVILFLLWSTFVLPSFKNTALIFPEIFFIQYFTIF